MTIWFASGNAHKKKEMSAIFAEVGILSKAENGDAAQGGDKLLIPADVGLAFDPLETGSSFYENSLIKAMALHALLRDASLFGPNDAIVADDSGLCVDSLGGRPGIFSARYMGAMSNEQLAMNNGKKLEAGERNSLLLEELGDAPDRKARFVCAMVLLFSPDRFFVAQETLEGEIVKSLECSRGSGGFGYDPILYIPQKGCTVAELSEAEKNRISHRGKAGKVIAGIMRARD